MHPYIIGISGRPINSSNTDRLIQAVFERKGLSCEFVKLTIQSQRVMRVRTHCGDRSGKGEG